MPSEPELSTGTSLLALALLAEMGLQNVTAASAVDSSGTQPSGQIQQPEEEMPADEEHSAEERAEIPLDELGDDLYDIPDWEESTGKGPDPYQVYLRSRFAALRPRYIETPMERMLRLYREDPDLSINVSVAPLPGGAGLGVSGTF